MSAADAPARGWLDPCFASGKMSGNEARNAARRGIEQT